MGLARSKCSEQFWSWQGFGLFVHILSHFNSRAHTVGQAVLGSGDSDDYSCQVTVVVQGGKTALKSRQLTCMAEVVSAVDRSEMGRGDGGRGFAGLPRVVSDELKEASEQGGAAMQADPGGGQHGGSRVGGRHGAWSQEGIWRELRV